LINVIYNTLLNITVPFPFLYQTNIGGAQNHIIKNFYDRFNFKPIYI